MARQSVQSLTHRCESERPAGFTLFELMVTVAVAAILVVVGVPTFTSFVQNNRAAAHANELVTAFSFARNEAIRRGAAIAICSSADGATCVGGNDWTVGWIVRTAGGQVLRAWPQRSGGPGVLSADVNTVQYTPQGSATAAVLPTRFRVRPPQCTGDQGRDVRLNAAGRTVVTREACP
jgi:type IV fimbrial biogenesis protein FimT